MLETDFTSETFYRKVHILIYTSSLVRHAVLKKLMLFSCHPRIHTKIMRQQQKKIFILFTATNLIND